MGSKRLIGDEENSISLHAAKGYTLRHTGKSSDKVLSNPREEVDGVLQTTDVSFEDNDNGYKRFSLEGAATRELPDAPESGNSKKLDLDMNLDFGF